MPAPEHKYTDRDVREDASLTELAIEYLKNYGGDFEPILNAQSALNLHGEINTVLTRVVLNCMRYDTNVSAMLPVPEHAYVQPVVRRLKSVSSYANPKDAKCNNAEPHCAHSFEGKKNLYIHCIGVPWEINRPRLWGGKTTFKSPFIMSRTGKKVHRVVPVHEKNLVMWHNKDIHSPGPATCFDWQVKLLCRYPSVVRKGQFLSEYEANCVINSFSDIEMCQACEYEMGS